MRSQVHVILNPDARHRIPLLSESEAAVQAVIPSEAASVAAESRDLVFGLNKKRGLFAALQSAIFNLNSSIFT
jgi:hypothetical protein